MKRKIFTTSKNNKVRAVGRQKKVYSDKDGERYFMWNGSKIYIYDIYAGDFDCEIVKESLNIHCLVGSITMCNTYGVMVEIALNDNYDHCIQLWEYVESEV